MRVTKRWLLLGGLLCLLLARTSWAQETIYIYTGGYYDSFFNFTPPCTDGPCANFLPGMRVTGEFRTVAPLPKNLNHVNIFPLLKEFSFNDGLHTYSSADPNTRASDFDISTDSSGNLALVPPDQINIQRWQTGSSPHTGGNRFASFAILKVTSGASNNLLCDFVVSSPQTGVADVCGSVMSEALSSGAITDAQGIWSQALAATQGTAVPTLSTGALVLLVLALGILSMTLRSRAGQRAKRQAR